MAGHQAWRCTVWCGLNAAGQTSLRYPYIDEAKHTSHSENNYHAAGLVGKCFGKNACQHDSVYTSHQTLCLST